MSNPENSCSNSKHISFDVENRTLSETEERDGVCMTPGCVKTACRILSSLDETVDPCDNFYRFACGGWLRNNDIPEGEKRWDPFTEVEHDTRRKMKALLEKELDGTEPAFFKMLKDFYDTCVDLETIDKLGSEPLKKDLASLGGWPVIEGSKWNESSFDWVDTLIAFRRLGYGFDMLIEVLVESDERNSTTNIIKLRHKYLGFVRDTMVFNNPEENNFYRIGVKEAVLLGADVNTAESELFKALEFDLELVKISLPEEEEKDDNGISAEITPSELKHFTLEKEKREEILNISRKRRERRYVQETYSKYTVAELQNMVPEIPWLRFFNGLLNDEIGETENVLVSDPVFLKKLGILLQKTEKRVIANYMFWKMVVPVKTDLSKEWREIDQDDFYQDKYRQNMCFWKVLHKLKVALNSYYVRLSFKEDSKNAVTELIKYIHRELLHIIEGSDWMDDVTKKEAIEKANSMKTNIGYPEEIFNDTAIMEIYESLTISNSSYYENAKNLRKWEKDKEFSSLRKPNVEKQWIEFAQAAASVYASYNPLANTIEFPAGILQGVFFDKDRPHYTNFGGIGYIIGHEVTHGFDVTGKKYDKNGNEVDWWDKTTDELYHKRVQCMIEQYSNYTLESGKKVNGELTQGENIADNGGLKEAYWAYHKWVEDYGPEPILPGIKYTQNQLFWISAAQVYCSKIGTGRTSIFMRSDPHSPDEFRVIGPMSNLEEFSEDFKCSPDSPMNRKNKCHVW